MLSLRTAIVSHGRLVKLAAKVMSGEDIAFLFCRCLWVLVLLLSSSLSLLAGRIFAVRRHLGSRTHGTTPNNQRRFHRAIVSRTVVLGSIARPTFGHVANERPPKPPPVPTSTAGEGNRQTLVRAPVYGQEEDGGSESSSKGGGCERRGRQWNPLPVSSLPDPGAVRGRGLAGAEPRHPVHEVRRWCDKHDPVWHQSRETDQLCVTGSQLGLQGLRLDCFYSKVCMDRTKLAA